MSASGEKAAWQGLMNRQQRRAQQARRRRPSTPFFRPAMKGGTVAYVSAAGIVTLLKDIWAPAAAIASYSLAHIWVVPASWAAVSALYVLGYDREKERQLGRLQKIRDKIGRR